jgi:microcystin-dependent protein
MADKHPPIGTVMAFAGNFLPNLQAWEDDKGWLLCDGRLLDRTASNNKFQPLFDVIGSSWGGDGANRFNVPDLRGHFLRGVSAETNRDPNANERTQIKPGGHAGNDVGSVQLDMIQSHKHNDSGHTHSASTTVSGVLPTWFGEEVEDGSGSLVNGNEGNQGNSNFNFPANTTIGTSTANIGEPVGSSAGSPRHGQETRPINAYVFWIIRWKRD